MKAFAKMMIAGGVIIAVGLVIFLVFLGLNGWAMNSEFEMKSYETAEEITALKIEFSAGTLVTEFVDDDKITVEYPENDGYTTTCTVTNGTLRISTGSRHWYNFMWFGKFPTTTLHIPKSCVLNLDLKVSAGDVTFGDADYGIIDIDMSAGALKFGKSTCTQLDCDVSAGDFKADGIVCQKADFDISAGNVKISELTCPEIYFDVSAGSANIGVNGSRAEYTISVSKSAGSCNLGNQTGGDKILRAKISAGSLNVNFSN